MGTRREGGRRSGGSGGGGGGGGGGGHTAASRHKAVSSTTTTATTNSSTTAPTRHAKLENERRNQETLKRLAGLQAPLKEPPPVISNPDGVVLKPGAPTLVPVIRTAHEEEFNKITEGREEDFNKITEGNSSNNNSHKTESNDNDTGNNKNSRETAYNAKNKSDNGGYEERQRSRKGRDITMSQQTHRSPINAGDSSLGRDDFRQAEVDSNRAGRGHEASPTKKAGSIIPGTPGRPRSARNASPVKGRGAGAGGGGSVRDPSPVRAPATLRKRDTSPVKAMSKTTRPTSASSMSSSSSSSFPSGKMPGVFERLTKSESSKPAHLNSTSSPKKAMIPASIASRARARSPTKSQRERSPSKATGKTLAASTTDTVDQGETHAEGRCMEDRGAPRTQERPRGSLPTEGRGHRSEEKNYSSPPSSHGSTRGVARQAATGRGEQTRNSHQRERKAARTGTQGRTSSLKVGEKKENGGVGVSGTGSIHRKLKTGNRTPSRRRSASTSDSDSEATPRTNKNSHGRPLATGTEGRGRGAGTSRPNQSPHLRRQQREVGLQPRGDAASSLGPGPTSSSKTSHNPRPRRPPSGSSLGSLHSSPSTSSITSLASSTSSSSSFIASSPSPHSPSPYPSPVPSSKNIRGGSGQGPTNCSAPAAAVRVATAAVQRASASPEKRHHSQEKRTRTKTLTEEEPKDEVEKKKKEEAQDKDAGKSTTAVTSCSTGKKRECDEEEKDVCDGDEDDEGEFYKVRVQTRLVTYRDSTLVIRNTSKVAPVKDPEYGGACNVDRSSSAGSVCSGDGGSGGEGSGGGGVPTTRTTSESSSLSNQGDSCGPHPAGTTTSTTTPSSDSLSSPLQTSSPPEVLQGVRRPTPTTATRHQRHHSDGALMSLGAAKGTARSKNDGVTPEGDGDGAVRDLSRLASLRGVRGRLSEFVNRGKLLVTDVCGAAAAQLPDMRRLQARLIGGGSSSSSRAITGGGGGGGSSGGHQEPELCRTPLDGTVDRLSISTPSSFSGVGELVGSVSEEGESGYFSWRQATSTPAVVRTGSMEEPSPGRLDQPFLSPTIEGQEAHPRDRSNMSQDSRTVTDKLLLQPPAAGEYRELEEAHGEEKAAKERQEREESEKEPVSKDLPKLAVLSAAGTETSLIRKKSSDEDTKVLKSLPTKDGLPGKEVPDSIAPLRCDRCHGIRKTRARRRIGSCVDGEMLKEGIGPGKEKGKKGETEVMDSNKLEGNGDILEGDSNKLEEEQSRTLTIEQVAETVSKEELDREEKEESRLKKKTGAKERSKRVAGKPDENSKKLREKSDSNTVLEDGKEEEVEKVCTCTDAGVEADHDDISFSALKDEVRQLLEADHARMWWTITGNFGNILPIDWSKTCTRQQYLPVLNLNQNKKGDGTEEGEGEEEDGEDEEEVAQDLDLHQLILSGLNQEPVKSAEEVIKEIDDIMQEGSSSEDECSEEGKKSDKEGDAVTTPTQAALPPPLYEEKLKNLSLSELNEVYMELEMVIRQYSETLISQLALRDELEYEKELKNSFISLLLQVQNKRRHFNVEKKKHKKTTGPNGTDPKYLTTVIPYDVGHGPPDNQTLQILIKILTAINEDSPTVPTLLTDYILKVLCPS